MSIIKKIAGYCFFLALALSGLIFVFLEVFLAYSTITDHKPAETESLVIVKTSLPDYHSCWQTEPLYLEYRVLRLGSIIVFLKNGKMKLK